MGAAQSGFAPFLRSSPAYFAEAAKAKKASSFAEASSYARASADKTAVKKATADKTTGRSVRPNGSFSGLPQKTNR